MDPIRKSRAEESQRPGGSLTIRAMVARAKRMNCTVWSRVEMKLFQAYRLCLWSGMYLTTEDTMKDTPAEWVRDERKSLGYAHAHA